ncbi:hypothetical protein Ae168Ps1_2138 [Pseudonocardia sp. Ae168_Ps1]|nr:hypothetical protein Ae150APs1_2130 [Pseudonocardia sp. Ae150A_Ps1]OLL79732.1 hypothetical protein Ae168Ps1_2138 [Pseudonocardia sp. Ae168_Ps1]OLL86133.1 hypothetical protein Ae263Ps1_3188c [Pseudonocardia sp. Ae263_Ps1]OLL93836.1 hypothetical protein Ae356Ps1_3733 [Pseudonocardia sp. Ae356_Ps1]
MPDPGGRATFAEGLDNIDPRRDGPWRTTPVAARPEAGRSRDRRGRGRPRRRLRRHRIPKGRPSTVDRCRARRVALVRRVPALHPGHRRPAGTAGRPPGTRSTWAPAPPSPSGGACPSQRSVTCGPGGSTTPAPTAEAVEPAFIM